MSSQVDSARSTKAALTVGLLTVLCPPGSALDPSLDINQYAHTAWLIREGFFKSMIYSIAQTHDGYLWLGAETGLLRFDGVRAVLWTPPGRERLPSPLIYRLLVARDGTLWIGTFSGLAKWDGAKLVRYPELDGQAVSALLEDRNGTVWAGSLAVPTGRLCAIQSVGTQCYGEDGSLGRGVLSLYEDGASNLWAGAETGLWRWRPGTPRRYAVPHSTSVLEIRDLNRTEDGQILMATNVGVNQFIHGTPQPYLAAGSAKVRSSNRLLRDQSGGLWVGTGDRGILHVHQGRTDAFSRSEGLSGDFVNAFFEDREGNVWMATNGGLDRFRELAVSTTSVDRLSNSDAWSVLGARDGSVWVGTRSGLNRWDGGRFEIFREARGLPRDLPQSLFQDNAGRLWLPTDHGLGYLQGGVFFAASGVPGGQVFAIAGDSAGNLWLSEYRNLLRITDGRVVEEIPWSRLGTTEDAIALQSGIEPGGLWLGFRLGRGVIYLKDGQIRQSYRAADGLGDGAVGGLKLDPDGALWAATAGGLSVIQNERVTTMTSKNGLPCDQVHWVMDDDDGSTWLYTACGLARLEHAEVQAWKADPKRAVHPTVFDSSDGVIARSVPPSGLGPRVTKSQDGKLWFLMGAGVSVVDPRHLPVNKLPPPVRIERIEADGKAVELKRGMRLPALTGRVWIDYTALSLVAPEKVHFKYKLEGQDQGWTEVVNQRQVQYTNLSPRQYRFRVKACNNSGVWNETGDTVEFSIAPAYYQTSWFRASLIAAFFLLLWGLYKLRLHQIGREFNAHMEGRVDERLRVARDLHDTLLQSFQASLIQMQAARNAFARRPEKAEQSLDSAINTAAEAIAEGRSAIQDLRVRHAVGGDLVQLLTAAGQELAHSDEAPQNPPMFRVTVEGEPHALEPLLQDEVYRIARELLRNAFRHARAERIEAEIRYESRQLRVHVRDDGKGIDPEILKAGGRTGHWGLPGMRERVDRFGGKLEFWSEAEAGTEAVLTVPAAAAHGGSHGGPFSFLRRKKARS